MSGSTVAWPRPMEYQAQPEKGNQRQLMENEVQYQDKAPLTDDEMGLSYLVFSLPDLAARLRYTTRSH